jgi:transposase
MKWIRENVNFLEDWPPNSPDLSPIENLWGRMWADALKSKPKDQDSLYAAVEKCFYEYPDEYIDNLVLSFRRRLEAVVEVQGGSISGKY